MTSVYRYYDERGALLYVGVTDRGVRRAHEHADSKPWWDHVATSTVEHFPSRQAALREERRLIETLLPIYNQQHNPLRSLPIAQRLAVASPLPQWMGDARRIAAIASKVARDLPLLASEQRQFDTWRTVKTQKRLLAHASMSGAPEDVVSQWRTVVEVPLSHNRPRLSRGEAVRAAQFLALLSEPIECEAAS